MNFLISPKDAAAFDFEFPIGARFERPRKYACSSLKMRWLSDYSVSCIFHRTIACRMIGRRRDFHPTKWTVQPANFTRIRAPGAAIPIQETRQQRRVNISEYDLETAAYKKRRSKRMYPMGNSKSKAAAVLRTN